jgi:radical SAM superfamily enzyme YgiQ (UPF0313 family)
MSEKLDILFLHVPKFSNYYKPFDEYMFINFVSMGLFALADITRAAGYKTKIVHLGIEWICDNDFSIIDYIEKTAPKVVAVPIFWHPQSYDAVEVIRAVKKRFPDIIIVTGGFTASYFADEIIREVKEVDALVRGHGEASILPVLERAAACPGGRDKLDLSNIANLLWKKYLPAGGFEVVANKEVFFASNADLDKLNFTNIALLNNYETYKNSFRLNVAYSKRISREDNLKITPVRAYHIPLFIGRGCPTECKLCAGRQKNQIKMNCSGAVIMRSIEKVCDSIEEIKKYGFDQVIVCTDPYPDKPQYFIDLFRRIRERGIEIEMFFESWGLPTREFIDEFGRTFHGRNSAIAISAESGSDLVRAKIRGYSFTNAELFNTLDYLEESRVGFLVFFTVGNPFETEADLDLTSQLIADIKDKYNFVRWLTTYPVQIEPGSAIFEEPELYGVEKMFYTFMDYYNFHGSRESCLYTNLGYNVKGYFKDEPELTSKAERVDWFCAQISRLRCEKFCILHPDPETARHYCDRQHQIYIEAGGGDYDKFERKSFV